MFRCIGRVTAVAGAFALAVALAFAPAAAAQVEPYGYDDYGGFRNILPPGQNGLDDLTQAAQFEADRHAPAAQSNDQLAMYSNLTTAVPITAAQIPQLLQGRDLRGARRGPRQQREPGAGRDDRARLGVRRAAYLR